MKCPICGNELEIKNKQIGTDNSGDPVFNEYAVCRDCKNSGIWTNNVQKAAAKASAKKPKRQIRPAAKNESDVAQKKDEKQNQKAHKEPEAAHTGSPKRAAAEASPKASDRVKSPAQNQKRRPDEKATDEKTVRFRKIEKKVPKRKPSSKQTTEKSAPNEDKRYSNIPPEQVRTKRRKLLKKAMMICLQQEFLILTK